MLKVNNKIDMQIKTVITITIITVLLMLKSKNNLEFLQTNEEVLAYIGSVLNSGEMTVTNLKVTGIINATNLTVTDTINAKNINATNDMKFKTNTVIANSNEISITLDAKDGKPLRYLTMSTDATSKNDARFVPSKDKIIKIVI